MARRSSRVPGRTTKGISRSAGGTAGRPDAVAAPRQRAAGSSDVPATRESRIGFYLGAIAFIALPLTYQWTFRPQTRPINSDVFVQALELLGILAAAGALFLGRRARATGDRSSNAVWAPRLGGAAIVGYAMAFFLLMSRPA